MYSVIIFGTGTTAMHVTDVLNNNVEILAYIDNNHEKWGNYFHLNNIIIESPDKIKKFKYDYIVIASQFNEEIYTQLLLMKICKNNILQFHKFLDMRFNHFKYNIDRFENEDNVKILITGISYASMGILNDLLCKKAYNLALGSQDLFYDYESIRYVFEKFSQKTSNIKYVIIGLCYYSFQYDLSLSAMRNKVVLYYPILKKAHHFNKINKLQLEFDINNDICNKIFRKNQTGQYDFKWQSSNFKDINNKEYIGEKQAQMDCNKNYPQTIKENIQIFKDYLKFLKDRNIEPIVLVFPASQYYTKHFSKRIEEEFHRIIDEVRKEYEFQYIDYFRLNVFTDDEFWDVSHLNSKGAEKFTKILNKEIKW